MVTRVLRLIDAIQGSDSDTLDAMLAEDVVFHSPVQTYRGRDQVVHLLGIIGTVLDSTEVTREVDGIILFAAYVEEHPVDGVLVHRVDEHGRITEITVMLRPLAALQAAVARMARALAEQ
jgi:SnoaL-like domain